VASYRGVIHGGILSTVWMRPWRRRLLFLKLRGDGRVEGPLSQPSNRDNASHPRWAVEVSKRRILTEAAIVGRTEWNTLTRGTFWRRGNARAKLQPCGPRKKVARLGNLCLENRRLA